MTTGNTTNTWWFDQDYATTTTGGPFYQVQDIHQVRPWAASCELRTIELKVGTKTVKIYLTNALTRYDEDIESMGLDMSVIADSVSIIVHDENGVAQLATEEELMEFLGQRPE